MMDYQACLNVLRNRLRIEKMDGLEIRVKPVPETDRSGVPDPREIAWMRKMKKSLGKEYAVQDLTRLTREDIQGLRSAMGCENADLSRGVTTSRKVIYAKTGNIPIWIYTPSGLGPFPIVVYFHGGGFFGGTTRVVENACRLLAERAAAVVLSVDYVLAPEYRFPKGLLQCWDVVRWAQENAREIQGDGTKIAVSGDSAGGNLAAACCLLDRNRIIKLQLLLYPAVIADSLVDYGWTLDAYEMNADVDDLLMMINDIKDSAGLLDFVYPETAADRFNQLFSPYLAADYHDFPETFIAIAEYDFLRIQAEKFAGKLIRAGVPVHFYRYGGMAHAFFEHTGEFPQAEDCTDEMAKLIRAM